MPLPDIFVLRKCSKTLKRKTDIFLSDTYAISAKTIDIVRFLTITDDNYFNRGTYYHNLYKYTVCCQKITQSYICMICGYFYCNIFSNSKCRTNSVKPVHRSQKNISKKEVPVSICAKCKPREKNCPTCNRYINADDSEWCMCKTCQNIFCKKPECIGFHNETFKNNTYAGEKTFLLNILALECRNCISACVRCSKPSSGVSCKYCNNSLCCECRIISQPNSLQTSPKTQADSTFFCIPCARQRL